MRPMFAAAYPLTRLRRNEYVCDALHATAARFRQPRPRPASFRDRHPAAPGLERCSAIARGSHRSLVVGRSELFPRPGPLT